MSIQAGGTIDKPAPQAEQDKFKYSTWENMSTSDMSTGTPVTGWEYAYLALRGINDQAMQAINLSAVQGWRLVQIVPSTASTNFPFMAILERALPAVTG